MTVGWLDRLAAGGDGAGGGQCLEVSQLRFKPIAQWMENDSASSSPGGFSSFLKLDQPDQPYEPYLISIFSSELETSDPRPIVTDRASTLGFTRSLHSPVRGGKVLSDSSSEVP